MRAAKRPVLALLKHAQEARLQIRRHIRDLVEEQCAAVCRPDHSRKILHRARERSFHITEKFAFNHCLRERRAIELHHWLSRAPARRANRVGDYFLADPAFAYDEDVGIRRSHRFDQFLDLLHRFALKNWRRARLRDLQAFFELLCFYAEFFRFSQEELFFQCLFHQAKQFLGGIRLTNEMVSAAFDRLDRIMQ